MIGFKLYMVSILLWLIVPDQFALHVRGKKREKARRLFNGPAGKRGTNDLRRNPVDTDIPTDEQPGPVGNVNGNAAVNTGNHNRPAPAPLPVPAPAPAPVPNPAPRPVQITTPSSPQDNGNPNAVPPVPDSGPAPGPGPASVSDSNQVNPGYKILMTSKGFNYIGRTMKTSLMEYLKNNAGKTSESKTSDGTTVKWSNVKVQKYNEDMKSDVAFKPGNGVEYRVQNLNLQMSSDYTLTQPQSPSSGQVALTANGVVLSMLISMLNSGGQLKPQLDECHCNSDKTDVQITKGSASDSDKFKKDTINGLLQNHLCSFAKTTFLPKLEKTFSGSPQVVNIFSDIYYNNALMQNPSVTQDGLVTSHAGSAFIRRPNVNDAGVPFNAPSIKPGPCPDHMICVFMSDYSLHSLIYFMSKQHRFDYIFSKEATPSFAKYLRTQCGKEETCSGTVVPSLPQKYPNSNLEVMIKSIPGKEVIMIKPELVNISGLNVASGYVRKSNGERDWLFSSNSQSYTTIKKPVFSSSNYTVTNKLDANHFHLYNVSTAVKDLDTDTLNMMTGFMVDNYVNPDLSKTLGQFMKVPRLVQLNVVNGITKFEDGRIVMAYDLCQNDEDCKAGAKERSKQNGHLGKPDYGSFYEG